MVSPLMSEPGATPGRRSSAEALELQYTIAAPDAGSTGTDGFQNGVARHGFQKCIELRSAAGELDGVVAVGDVDDAAAEDVGHALHLLPVLTHRAHFHQHELALDVVALGQVYDLDYVHQLVELLVDLLDDIVRAAGDDRHPRHGRVL